MRLLSFLFVNLFLVSSFALANIGNFCQDVTPETFDDFVKIFEARDDLQLALHARNDLENVQLLLANYNTLRVQLTDATSEDLFPVLQIAGICYAGQGAQVNEIVRTTYCPQIDTKIINPAVELALTAKAIVNLTSHGDGDKPAIISLVENSAIGPTFGNVILSLYDACGSLLGSSKDVEIIEIPEDLPDDVPGVCTASPFSLITDFLWKPVSDGDGKLVILTNPASSIDVDHEDLIDRGASNSRCTTARGTKSGAGYGKDVFVAVTTAREFLIILIPDGKNRYDCRGSLGNCGITVYDEKDIQQANSKFKKLKKKKKKAKTKKKKKRIKKQIKKLKKLVKYAKSQGAV